jgi:hypothetical protein
MLPNCSPQGAFCDAFLAELSCDEPKAMDANPVDIHILMTRSGGGGCYTPLFKSTRYVWNAHIDMDASSLGGTKSVTLVIQGNSTASMNGFGSCYMYQRLAGQDLARVVAGAINDTLAAH